MAENRHSDRQTCKFDKSELEKRLRERGLEESEIISVLKEYPEDWKCQRTVDKCSVDGYCAFHSEEKPKDFETCFWEELKNMEENDEAIDFTGAIFPSMVFSSPERPLRLSKPVIFIGAEFQDRADFSGAKFGSADFRGAAFKGTVLFMRSSFAAHTRFDRAEFDGIVVFRTVDFKAAVYFIGTIFRNNVYFLGVNFSRWAKFKDSEFKGDLILRGGTTFNGEAFLEFKTEGSVNLIDVTFNGPLFFKPLVKENGLVLFHRVIFNHPKKVILAGLPLSSTSFLVTDLSDIILVPSRESDEILDEKLWRFHELSLKNKRNKNGSEDYVRNKLMKIFKGFTRSLDRIRRKKAALALTEKEEEAYKILRPYLMRELIIAEYKAIRKCLESNRMFTEASWFFIREMKLARDRLSCRNLEEIPEKIAHYIYDCVARYGESIARPIAWFLLLIFISPIFLSWIQTGMWNPMPAFAWIVGHLSEAIYSYFNLMTEVLAIFFHIRSLKDFSNATSSGLLLFCEVVIRLSSIVLLGSMFIALKRRLERK